ncbi:MAG: hypothetical protein ACREUF_16665, partial [Solimonas sp.]
YALDTKAKTLAKAGSWNDAADLYARALTLYPADDLLKNNIAVLAQEWQKAAYAKGGATEVSAVQAILASKVPGVSTLGNSGRDQIRRTVNEQVRSRDFAKALETLKSASSLLAPADMTQLNELVYDNWAKERAAAKDWAAAADIYATGLAAAGPTDLLRNNITYLAQEWARAAFASGGIDATIQVAQQAMAKFPGVPDVKAGPAAVIANAVQDRVKAASFPDAIAMIERAGEALSADRQRQLFEYSYDNWAKTFFGKKQWDEAIKIYDQGLARLPNNSLLTQNRAYCLAQRK